MATVDPPDATSPRPARWIPQATGVFLLFVVVLGYTVALRAGRWPPSHPWSGLALAMLAVGQLMAPASGRGRRAVPAMRLAAPLLAVVAGLCWLIAVFLRAST